MTQITRGQFAITAVVVAVLAWMGAHAGPSRAPSAAGPAPGAVEVSGTSAPRPGAAPADRGEPGTGTTAADSGGAVSTGTTVRRAPRSRVVVHVAGAVRRPGVYRLQDGQRVADAVRRAGGGSRGADLDAINLATKVRDGVQILVPRRGTAGVTAGGTAPAVGAASSAGAVPPGTAAATAVLDLNTATAEQLETLDGVGPATAAKILQFRAEHGPFHTVDDLEQIPGIGPKKLEAMRPRVRV